MAGIALPENPIEKDFEDYLSAALASSNLFVERNIIDKGVEEVLEIDAIASRIDTNPPQSYIFEAKSKAWGFNDLMNYPAASSGVSRPSPKSLTPQAAGNITR